MSNCVVTSASLSNHSACETIKEAVDEDKWLDEIEVDGWLIVVART